MNINNAGILGNFAINITGNSNQVVLALGAAHNAVGKLGKQADETKQTWLQAFSQMVGGSDNLKVSLGKVSIMLGVIGKAGQALVALAMNSNAMESAMRRLDSTFGTAADKIVADIDKMAEAFGAPKEEMVSMAAAAGRAFQGLGIGAEKAAAMTSAIIKRSTDIAADGTMTVGEAMRAMISAVEGGGGALRGLGAEMTEAEIYSKALSLGLIRANGVITDADRAFVRFTVAMNGTASAEGAAEARAGSFEAAASRLDRTLRLLGSAIGDSLAPGFALFADGLTVVTQRAITFVGYIRQAVDAVSAFSIAALTGFDAKEIGAVMDENRRFFQEEDRKHRQAEAERENAKRNVSLKADQQTFANHHGSSTTSLRDMAQGLQAAGFRQRAIGERRLEELKAIRAEAEKANRKAGAPDPNAAKAAGK